MLLRKWNNWNFSKLLRISNKATTTPVHIHTILPGCITYLQLQNRQLISQCPGFKSRFTKDLVTLNKSSLICVSKIKSKPPWSGIAIIIPQTKRGSMKLMKVPCKIQPEPRGTQSQLPRSKLNSLFFLNTNTWCHSDSFVCLLVRFSCPRNSKVKWNQGELLILI